MDGLEQSSADFLPQRRLLLFLALLALVLWGDLVRYLDPIGEKHFPTMAPGAADFSVIFDGTRVFLAGQNPYYYRDANSEDRWQRGDIIGGRWFRVAYQPSHFLLYIPVALITTDNRQAGRIVFGLSLACYFLLAYLTWQLVLGMTSPTGEAKRLALLLLPLLAVLLVANVGSALSLARCQSDIINAVLCWAAVVLFLRGRRFWPMFLITSAIAIKGYGAFLGLGLFLLGLRPGEKRATTLGVLAAMAFWLLPVLPYLHDGTIAAIGHAVGFFNGTWLNHSFANVFFHLHPGLVHGGRLVATLLALSVAAGAWWHTRRALQRGDAPATALWLTMFALAALTTMVGASALSYIYNQILVLPGVLILLAVGDQLWRSCGFSSRTMTWLLALEAVMGFLLFKYQLAPFSAPLAGMGNLLIVLMLGFAVAGRFRQGRREGVR